MKSFLKKIHLRQRSGPSEHMPRGAYSRMVSGPGERLSWASLRAGHRAMLSTVFVSLKNRATGQQPGRPGKPVPTTPSTACLATDHHAVTATAPMHRKGRESPGASWEKPRRCGGQSQKSCQEKKSQRHISMSQRISTTAFKTFSEKSWNFNVVRGLKLNLQPEPREDRHGMGTALFKRGQSLGFVFRILCCIL